MKAKTASGSWAERHGIVIDITAERPNCDYQMLFLTEEETSSISPLLASKASSPVQKQIARAVLLRLQDGELLDFITTVLGERRQGAQSLNSLELSIRAVNCLESEGITTIADLCGRTADELLEVRNFGESTLREVRAKLTEHGLQLRGE